MAVLYRECLAPDILVSLASTANSYQGCQESAMIVRDVCPACGAEPFIDILTALKDGDSCCP